LNTALWKLAVMYRYHCRSATLDSGRRFHVLLVQEPPRVVRAEVGHVLVGEACGALDGAHHLVVQHSQPVHAVGPRQPIVQAVGPSASALSGCRWGGTGWWPRCRRPPGPGSTWAVAAPAPARH
jgi:hypothetical protein